MSHFLDQIATKNLDSPEIQPRLPGLFEPEPWLSQPAAVSWPGRVGVEREGLEAGPLETFSPWPASGPDIPPLPPPLARVSQPAESPTFAGQPPEHSANRAGSVPVEPALPKAAGDTNLGPQPEAFAKPGSKTSTSLVTRSGPSSRPAKSETNPFPAPPAAKSEPEQSQPVREVMPEAKPSVETRLFQVETFLVQVRPQLGSIPSQPPLPAPEKGPGAAEPAMIRPSAFSDQPRPELVSLASTQPVPTLSLLSKTLRNAAGEPQLLSPVAPGRRGNTSRPYPTTPSPTPTIQVSIGRIEIRATPPPAAASKKRAEPAPVMTLAEYLSRRRGEERG